MKPLWVGGVVVKIGVAAGESVEGWSQFVVHIRGWNGRKGQVMEMTTWKAEMKMTQRTYLKAFAFAPC